MQSGTVRAGGGAEEAAAGEYTCSGRTIQLLLRRWLLAAGRACWALPGCICICAARADAAYSS